MGNRTSSNGGSPKTSATLQEPSMKSQYKRALARIPRSKVPRIRQIFEELKRQSSTSGDRVDKSAFLRYFPLPGMMGERLFSVFDKDGNGSIDFPEFLTGLTMIYHGTIEDKKKFLFNMYDLDGNGEITSDELFTMLSYIPAAFRVLEIQDPDEEKTSTAVATYKPTPEVEEKIRSIVDSVFAYGKKETLSYEEFQLAVTRNSAISEIINIFYDDAMPENELAIDDDSVEVELQNSSKLNASVNVVVSRGVSESNIVSPRMRCKCPLCETVIQFVHCIQCGSILSGNRGVVVVAADLQASNCNKCGLKLPEPRHCFSCGHPLKSTLDQREETESSVSDTDDEQDNENKAEGTIGRLDESSEIVVSGYLSKIGRATQTKQTRFFALRDCFLYYYTKEPSDVNAAPPKGVVFLTGLVVSPMSLEDNRNGKYGFILKSSSGRHRAFFCADNIEQQKWLSALSRASRTRSVFDHYQLDLSSSPIGIGKFSKVYSAIDKVKGEKVAIKVLNSLSSDEEDREFMRTELAIVKLVAHPNIVRTIDVFESIDKIYIVMERVRGGDLLNKLQLMGRMAEFDAQRTVLALVNAIQYLHEKGIIHRDIKPENVLITEEGLVKLTDFGLSALVPHSKTLEAPLGTVSYAAPEVLLSMPYDKAVDMWSLGALTFVMLSGQMPFRGKTDKEVAANALKAKFSFANSKVWDEVSESGKDFISKLLVKQPEKRLTVAQALQHEWLVLFKQ
jgi:Ca2+-binding EF-hand superfamily protein